MPLSRRTFLARCTVATTAATVAYSSASAIESKNDRPKLGLIGAGWQPATKRQGRGIAIGKQAANFGDIATICELDSIAAEFANRTVAKGNASLVDDYRHVLDDPSIDAVLIATPDHWHAKIAIEAMRAGKDVYCEKPVAVTVQEGQWLRKVVEQTGRVFQVGTQQRSEYNQRFLQAIALVQQNRIGRLKQIRIGLGPGWQGGPFKSQQAPKTLQWEKWLGPAPLTEYIPQRTHRTFRWWFEYAGGQLCDWGAHHVDIAQWAIGAQHGGPTEVSGTASMNQPLSNGQPTRDDSFNTPIEFSVACKFDAAEILIDSSRNGITFEGDDGRFFVNRGKLEGKPVEALKQHPLPDDAVRKLYGGQQPTSHMQNFFDCLQSRQTPISDIDTHHRILTTCHLANITLRLGRKIRWDSSTEQCAGDDVANSLLSRTYRDGYQIEGLPTA